MKRRPPIDALRSSRGVLHRVFRNPVTGSTAITAALMVLALGCRGDGTTGPEAVATALEVTTSTTGDSLDSDGYTVTVDDGSGLAVGLNDTTVVAGLKAEDHTVELSDVASHCSTSGSNPRAVTVVENDTGSTGFDVTCEAMASQSASAEFRGNEPSGMTTVVDHPFNDLDNGGKWNVYRVDGFSLLTDTTAPTSPDSVIRTTYEAGPLDGHSPSGMDYQPGKYRQYYVSFWARWSENWQGHKSGVNKILFLNYADFSSGVVIENHAIDDGPMRWQVVVQAGGLPSQKFRPNVTTTNFKRGDWVLWEVYVVMNTEGNSDGEMHAWIDGIKQFEKTDIQFVSSDNEEKFGEINYEPIWGGRTDTVIERMHHDMDHLYISAR